MAEAPLAGLHDLALPAAVGAWPPAPAALALLALLGAALLLGAVLLWRRRRANAYRRIALAQLHTLAAECQAQPQRLSELPLLLKHCALQAWPREQVAALHGHAWLDFLAAQAPGVALPASLAELGYWPAARLAGLPAAERQRLLHASGLWIRRHVRP